MKKILALLGLFISASAFAHESHGVPMGVPNRLAYEEINRLYQENVVPIFKIKCFDCHSHQTTYPWYYKIPGVKQFLDSDIREGLEHFDFTQGFPFGGHHPALEQPEAIEESIAEGDMPPWRYRLMHKGSALTEREKQDILNWVRTSRQLLTLPADSGIEGR